MISKKQFGTVTFIVIIITALLTWAINNFVVYGISDEMTGKFRTIASIIQRNSYYDITDDVLQDGSIQGMVASLGDADSVYMTAEEVQAFENQFSAEYTGIGIKTTKIISGFMVVDIAEKSPAKEAGMQLNDIIIKINDEDIRKSEDTMSELMSKKTLQSLTILRGDEEIKLTLTEATSDFTTSISQIYEINGKNILVFDLQQFTDKTVSLLASDLKKLNTEDVDGVIIDLRNNNGGSVDTAKKILEMTVRGVDEDGQNFSLFSVQTRDQAKIEPELRAEAEADGEITEEEESEILLKTRTANESTRKEFAITQPTVILVNEKTASAAEMVAAGMKEIDSIPLIGNSTYGKGTIQEIIHIVNDGSAIKLTTKKWFTPTGETLTEENPLQPTEVSVDSLPFTVTTISATKEHKNGDKDTSTSSTIANVQMVLSYFGYNANRADGLFDDETEKQLKLYQKDNGLEETGTINFSTLRKINEKLVNHTEDINNDVTMQKAFRIVETKIAELPVVEEETTENNETTTQQ